MLKIEDSDKNIVDNDIHVFEKKYEINLPNSYKKFLKKYNGGVLYEEHPFLTGFNSLKYNDNNTSLESTYETCCVINKDIELDMLPIGFTHSGNPVVLSLKNDETQGKIYIFYFDRISDPEIAADSLEDLLGIYSIDDL